MNLETKRKLAKEKVPQLRLVYWDVKKKQKFEVLYPPQGQKLTIGLGIKKNHVETLPAPTYCHDKDSALRFARMRWELLARSETTYIIETRHLKIRGPDVSEQVIETGEMFVDRSTSEFDLLRLREGDAVAVKFDPFNGEDMRVMDFGQRVQFLQSLGYAPNLCAFVSTNIERLNQFKQPYYTKQVEFDFDQKDGLQIKITAVNFAYERREIAFADSFEPADVISGAS